MSACCCWSALSTPLQNIKLAAIIGCRFLRLGSVDDLGQFPNSFFGEKSYAVCVHIDNHMIIQGFILIPDIFGEQKSWFFM